MGSFSIIQNNLDKNILNFIDIIYSNSLYPIINTPARAMSISFTLIDNISFNDTVQSISIRNISQFAFQIIKKNSCCS